MDIYPTLFCCVPILVDHVTATDGLAEALVLLPNAFRARLVIPIAQPPGPFWLQVERWPGANWGQFVLACHACGMDLVPATAEQQGEFAKQFSFLQSERSRSPVPRAFSLVALPIRELGAVTVPGSMRAVLQRLSNSSQSGWVVLEFQTGPQVGLAWFDLTVMLVGWEGQAPADVERMGRAVLSSQLQGMPGRCSGRRIQRLVQGLGSNGPQWRRPRLPACLGNLADLFPL